MELIWYSIGMVVGVILGGAGICMAVGLLRYRNA